VTLLHHSLPLGLGNGVLTDVKRLGNLDEVFGAVALVAHDEVTGLDEDQFQGQVERQKNG
jgi:hypothetical protein